MREKKKYLKKWGIPLTLVLLLFLAAVSTHMTEEVQEIKYTNFIDIVEKEASSIKIIKYFEDAEFLTGTLNDGNQFKVRNPQDDGFRRYLLEQGIEVSSELDSTTMLAKVIASIVPYFVLGGVLVFASMYMYKSRDKETNLKVDLIQKSKVAFEDVAGNEEAKENMVELLDFLKEPQKFAKFGANLPKGTILYGPPGTGKTLMAKALAGTAGVPFIAVSGSDFVEKYAGIGASRVRQIFNIARENQPCIVFIDEIDAVGRKRNSDLNSERDQTLNQLLVEMDGFSPNEGILVITATNRLDTLDEALLRSGRFDRHIKVELPDLEARRKIIEIHAKNKPLEDGVNLGTVAKMTTYMSGADLENILNEASICAVRNHHKEIMMSDVAKAIDKVLVGDQKKNHKKQRKEEKATIAYHEAGHALVSKLVMKQSIPKVSIIPTTKGVGGYTLFTPEEKMLDSKKDLANKICMILGGRAAEEITLGLECITNGASNDLRKATMIAKQMVKVYGMSDKIGLINIEELFGQNAIESTDSAIAREVKAIIDKEYGKTIDLLANHSTALTAIANELIEKETIYEEELNQIIESAEELAVDFKVATND